MPQSANALTIDELSSTIPFSSTVRVKRKIAFCSAVRETAIFEKPG